MVVLVVDWCGYGIRIKVDRLWLGDFRLCLLGGGIGVEVEDVGVLEVEVGFGFGCRCRGCVW